MWVTSVLSKSSRIEREVKQTGSEISGGVRSYELACGSAIHDPSGES